MLKVSASLSVAFETQLGQRKIPDQQRACLELAEPGFVVLPNPGLFSTCTQFRSSANPRHSGTVFSVGSITFMFSGGVVLLGLLTCVRRTFFIPYSALLHTGYAKPLDIEFRGLENNGLYLDGLVSTYSCSGWRFAWCGRNGHSPSM